MGVSAGVGLNLLAASADDSVVRLVLIALVGAASPDEQVGLMRKALVPLAGSVGAALAALLLFAAPASAHHSFDLDCTDFSSQAAAQYHMNAHPGDLDGLDGNDNDGRACESNPCPCHYGSATQPELPAVPPPPPSSPPQLPLPPPPLPPVEPQPQAKRYSARIVRVTDGDTVKVRLRSGTFKTVRLIGIDTPESRKPGVPVECGAKQATAAMIKLALRKRRGAHVGHAVRLTTDPTQDRIDRFGRLLAYVERRSDGLDLGRAMMRAGWAMAYVYDGTPFQRYAAYSAVQTQAEAAHRGVWSSCGGDVHSAQ
jgi:micrococcal nuclease